MNPLANIIMAYAEIPPCIPYIDKKWPTTNYWLVDIVISSYQYPFLPLELFPFTQKELEQAEKKAKKEAESEISRRPPSRRMNFRRRVGRCLWRGFLIERKELNKSLFNSYRDNIGMIKKDWEEYAYWQYYKEHVQYQVLEIFSCLVENFRRI